MTENKSTGSSMTEQEFLANYNIANFDRPSLASDIVLLSLRRDESNNSDKRANVNALQILLIKRASHPFMNKWALPGGFCKPTETVYETAKRELFEETNVSDAYLKLSGVHSKQNRDPRGWIISNAWLGLIDRYQCELRADTDAWEAVWFTVKSLESTITNGNMNMTEYTHKLTLVNDETNETLTCVVTETIILNVNSSESVFNTVSSDFAFDNDENITQALVSFREEIKENIKPLFNLVPDLFTLTELQTAYELILDTKSQNFRRRIDDYVQATETFVEVQAIRPCRPARLFMKNPEKFKYK